MLLHLLVLLLAPGLATCATPQEPAVRVGSSTRVLLPHDWAAGTRYTLSYVKEREDYEGAQLVKRNVSTTPITVEYAARNERGFVVRWTFGRTAVATDDAAAASLASSIASINEGFALDLQLDAQGSVIGFTDEARALESFRAHHARVKHMLLEQLGQDPATREVLERALDVSAGLLDGPLFRSAMLRDPGLFHSWCGGEYELGQRTESDAELPSPLGGSLPARRAVELVRLQSEPPEAVLEHTLTMDPATARRALTEALQQLARQNGDTPPKDAEVPHFLINDCTTHVFDLASGSPKRVEFVRTIETEGARRIERSRFTLTPPQ